MTQIQNTVVAASSRNEKTVWTVQEILIWSTNFLTEKSLPTPRLDVEVLLAFTLGCKRIDLYVNYAKPLTQSERDLFRSLLKRRVQGEPVAYITGEKEFFGRKFAVSDSVLIPRPDTEVLVEEALELAKQNPHIGSGEILDIGTGSGCIGLSLALAWPQAKITAIDISPKALEIAQRNAKELNCQNIRFLLCDALKGDLWASTAKYDLIVSNPPYIGFSEREDLPGSVKDFEPASALFAEEEGLAFYRQIAGQAGGILNDEGFVLCEIGSTQGQKVSELFQQFGWFDVSLRRDYGQHDRVVKARKAPKA